MAQGDAAEALEVRAEIVSIGTELLLGEITDTNASWIAGNLPALGIPVFRIQQTGDNRARLTALLRDAWTRAEVLILTGGLGPTEDDVTREAIADLLGEQMEVVPALEQQLRAFFTHRNRAMPPRNVKQATVIPSATALPNPIGTAPGWWVEHQGRYIATMPGVPHEMRRMWADQVGPRLLDLPRGGAIVTRTLKILGLGESAVEHDLGDLVRSTNPTVATYAKADGIHVRLAARSRDQEEAWAAIAAVERQVRALFGARIYGVDHDDLGTATARLLAARGVSVGMAEMGLGGALCSQLRSVPQAHGLMLPAAPAGAESLEEVALSLAHRARAMFSTTLGIGAVVAPRETDRQEVAAAVEDDAGTAVQREIHRTGSDDAARRAALLAIRALREYKDLS